MEVVKVGSQFGRALGAEACPAWASEVREASEGAVPLRTGCEKACLLEVSAEEAWLWVGRMETPGRGVLGPLM